MLSDRSRRRSGWSTDPTRQLRWHRRRVVGHWTQPQSTAEAAARRRQLELCRRCALRLAAAESGPWRRFGSSLHGTANLPRLKATALAASTVQPDPKERAVIDPEHLKDHALKSEHWSQFLEVCRPPSTCDFEHHRHRHRCGQVLRYCSSSTSLRRTSVLTAGITQTRPRAAQSGPAKPTRNAVPPPRRRRSLGRVHSCATAASQFTRRIRRDLQNRSAAKRPSKRRSAAPAPWRTRPRAERWIGTASTASSSTAPSSGTNGNSKGSSSTHIDHYNCAPSAPPFTTTSNARRRRPTHQTKRR